jgi:glycine cleavage system H protein
MSEVKEGLYYTEEHEWAEPTGAGTVRIGITDFAQNQLGDIVFVEFPEVGVTVEAEQPMGTIESVKTVSELNSPVSGKVIKVNGALIDSPELLNSEPYGSGWIVEVEVEGDLPETLGRLQTAEQYASYTEGKE